MKRMRLNVQQQNLHVYMPNGGWLDYWVKNAASIKKFIAENRLQPLAVSAPLAAGVKATGISRVIDLGIYGGIKVAHLHLGNDVYLLTEKQWAAFSSNILAQARSVLATAQTVGFDAGLELGTAVQGVATPAPLGFKVHRG